MNRDLLLKMYPHIYLKIQVEDMPNTENDSFLNLLLYIGKNNGINKNIFGKINPSWGYISKAYDMIQEKTDELLGINQKGFPGIKRLKLKTSQWQIKEITRFRKNNKETFVKIPYKALFIFKAIVAILEEMKNRSNSLPIPANLKEYIGQTYRVAFYAEQIEGYNRVYDSFLNEEKTKKELKNDFEAPASPFNIKFGIERHKK